MPKGWRCCAKTSKCSECRVRLRCRFARGGDDDGRRGDPMPSSANARNKGFCEVRGGIWFDTHN